MWKVCLTWALFAKPMHENGMLRYTQGNYATQDDNGMCHLIPLLNLPEWREEDERAFVHCGSSGLNHAITSNRVGHKAFQFIVHHFIMILCKCSWQWLAQCCLGRNRRGGWWGRGRVPPQDFWPGNFCWPIGKERQGKRENEAEKKENRERKGGKMKMEWGKVKKWGEDFFFALHFSKDQNLFWVNQNGNFLPGKSISRREKKSGKINLPSQKNILVATPDWYMPLLFWVA